MFESLSDRLGATLDGLRGQGRLGEEDIQKAMREIRLALLEADVNFGVVRDFVAKVRERAMGSEVLSSLTPGQQVVKIVHEELTLLMGNAGSGLSFANRPPTVVLMVGLQGSGKTTACGKLARMLAKQKRSPAMVACDLQRPAAVQQLQTLGKSLQVPVYEQGTDADPGGGRGMGGRAGTGAGARRRHRRHRRAPARRSRADGRARAHEAEGEAPQRAARARLDDGPGRRERRPELRRGGRLRRRHPDQARRRCPRRRRARGARDHRQADQVRVGGREARPARGVPPRPAWPPASSAWAT